VPIIFRRSASRHGISHERSTYVIEHCGLPFDDVAGEGVSLYLGDDWNEVPLEIGAAVSGDDLVVIHAMKLRDKFRELYEEALQWRK
jgi:hypothetical protein